MVCASSTFPTNRRHKVNEDVPEISARCGNVGGIWNARAGKHLKGTFNTQRNFGHDDAFPGRSAAELCDRNQRLATARRSCYRVAN